MSGLESRIDEYPFIVRPMTADEGSGYLIEYPDIPGCISDGASPEEAIRNGKDALRSVLLTKQEFGDPIPLPGERSVMPVPAKLRTRLDERARKERTDSSALAAKLIAEGLDAA